MASSPLANSLRAYESQHSLEVSVQTWLSVELTSQNEEPSVS
jgi:hypothetical protein